MRYDRRKDKFELFRKEMDCLRKPIMKNPIHNFKEEPEKKQKGYL